MDTIQIGLNLNQSIDVETMKDILELQLKDLHTQLVKSKNPILIKPDEGAKEFLIKKVMKNATKGARNIRDILDRYIKEPIAELINCFRVIKGDIVYIKLGKNDRGKDKMIFYRELRPNELKKTDDIKPTE